MVEAGFYECEEAGRLRCRLCAHSCSLGEGQVGLCGVREAREGVLYSLSYGRLAAAAVDPIEKKPFFHVLPGSKSFSVATPGCNMSCRHCQNAELSQGPREGRGIRGRFAAPEQIVEAAGSRGCRSIAYTYSEPTVFYEYARDIAGLAREKGLLNLFVTNGYISAEALRASVPWLNGANVDLKAFSDEFYRDVCGARLEPVLETIALMKELGIWVEVTTLLIPGYNDAPTELGRLAEFLAGLDPLIPWHVTAFRPTHKLLAPPPTSVEILLRARRIGRAAGLAYVYAGNVPGNEGECTDCPACGERLITRRGFAVEKIALRQGTCPSCAAAVPGIFADEVADSC